jgi:hypothetical protein
MRLLASQEGLCSLELVELVTVDNYLVRDFLEKFIFAQLIKKISALMDPVGSLPNSHAVNSVNNVHTCKSLRLTILPFSNSQSLSSYGYDRQVAVSSIYASVGIAISTFTENKSAFLEVMTSSSYYIYSDDGGRMIL